MASDKLMNHTQGETIITKLTSIADSLDDLAAVTPAKLGMGIATCDTAASTAAKTAALANFALVEGAPVSVQFTYANTATNATLNINNTGAKPIIYKDAAIGNDVISAGDTCTFIYTTNTYKITNIDTLTGPGSGTVRQVGAENGLITDQTDNADIQTTGNIGLNLKSTTAFSTEVGAHNTSTDNMYPVALDSEGHPVAAVPTMSASGSGHKGGLVPDPGSTAGTKKYLAEDGEWKAPDSEFASTPTDNTIPSSKLVKDSLDAKVAGPGSSTQNNIATYSDTSGKTVKDSGVHVVNYATGADTSKDDEVPTSKAVNKMITDKGYVVGPSSVTGDTIALFDSTTGKLIKSSSKTFDSSAISNDANKVPTSKLVYEGLGGKVSTSRTINDKELSSNVTLSGDDLKLTNYSKTTSKDSLAATDKVNQAFDKLENRIVANQSNILYAINTGVRNICTNAEYNSGDGERDNITYKTLSDGTITFKTPTGEQSSSSDNIFFNVWFKDANTVLLPTGNYIAKLFGSDINNIRIEYSYMLNGSSVTNKGNFGEAFEIVIPSGITGSWLRVCAKPNTSFNSSFKIVVCDKTVWNTYTPTDYIPAAVPNYDLTRLEAEDRAALAQEIDAGAKNRLDFATWAANVNVTRGTKTVSGNSITLTATGNDCSTKWNPGDSGEYIYKIPVTAGEKLVLSWNANTSTTGKGRVFIFYSGVAETSVYTDANSKVLEATIPSGCTFITFRFGVETNGDSITYSNVMLCTKAAFGVSSKFVPYRPNYDLVAQTVAHDIVFKKKSETITTANTWQVYSSLAVTLPVGKTIDITAAAEWSHNSPASEIAIIKGTTVTGTQIIATNTAPSGGQLSLCAHGMYYNGLNTDVTINIAVKYPSTENNQVSIAYRIF